MWFNREANKCKQRYIELLLNAAIGSFEVFVNVQYMSAIITYHMKRYLILELQAVMTGSKPPEWVPPNSPCCCCCVVCFSGSKFEIQNGVFFDTFVAFPQCFVTFLFQVFCHFFVLKHFWYFLCFCHFFHIFFFSNAIKLNKTPKCNESSELILYLTGEERCVEPSMFFFFFLEFGWKKPKFLIKKHFWKKFMLV